MTAERSTALPRILRMVLTLCAALSLAVGVRAQNPVPFTNSISPVSIAPGSADFTLTVNGAGFVQGAVVNWIVGATTTSLATNFVSATKLTAGIPSSLVASAQTASITVKNPGPGGVGSGIASNVILLPITTPASTISMGGPDIAIGPTPFSSVVGDFNGDGRPDVAELLSDSIAILLNNGDGTFNTSFIDASFGTAGQAVLSRSIVMGDFNGDGRTDLAVLRWNIAGDAPCPSGGFVGILLGNGDGTFSALPAPTCVGINPLSLVAADFNGDGKLDLAVANNCGDPQCDFTPGTVSILLGNGDGTFAPASTLVAGPLDALPQAITTGDFNGDGKVDLAVSNCLGACFFGEVTILLGNGDGSFTPTSTSPPTGSVPFSIAAADLNGDGILDLIVANECRPGNCLLGSISVLKGNGDGTFTALPMLDLDSRPQGIAVGDFNGDGKLDVIVGGAFMVDTFNGAATFLLGNGDGTFKISPQSLSPGFVNALSPADFDGDGKLDLALAAYPSHATVLLQSLGVTLSATRLIFGPRPVGTTSAAQSVTLTNTGTRTESISAMNVITGDGTTPLVAFSQTNDCGSVLAPGVSCTVNVFFNPPQAGVLTGNLSITLSPGGERTVSLTGVGGPGVFLSPTSLSFPLTLDTTGSGPQSLRLTNISPLPAPITSLAIAGSFSQTNDCAGAVPPLGSCFMFVTFVPTVSGPVAGSLTATVQSGVFSLPLVATLSGTGSAVKLRPFPGTLFDFGTLYLGDTSDPVLVTLTNLSMLPLTLNSISASGSGFKEKDDCSQRLSAGESCTISTTFRPMFDSGPAKGTLLIDANDPVGPQAFSLTGTGIGISHNVVLLHYDYMVAADHTHDPEVVAPGAIQAVVDAFARHGITAIIDPRHTAIPETAVIVFGSGSCNSVFGFELVSFSDLKAKYFPSPNPRVHYSIFGHFTADSNPLDPSRCDPFAFSGFAELPGQNFVNGLYFITPDDGFTPSLARLAVAGSYMHEFGHNLGLHHGGGIGPLGTDSDDFQRNFKPNYISIMNYNYLFSGIAEADTLGSTNLRACAVDSDCGDSALCTDTASAAPFPAKACFRLDYSRQLLPTGGNTPGALDENGNLDETAGLGSGNSDITFFADARCNFQVAPSNGPLDFDGDGSATNTHATADLIPGWWGRGCPSGIYVKLGGFDDWAALAVKVDDIETQNSLNASAPHDFAREVDLTTLKDKHLLYPPRQASIVIHPGCTLASAPLASGQSGTVTVAILGSASLDVTHIDASSLRLHGVAPLSTSVADVNSDGQPDLVAVFDSSQIHLSPQATTVRLTGWMTSSQRFFASAPVTIVNDMSAQPAACQN